MIKFGLGSFARLSQVILTEIPDDSLATHMNGHEGNLLVVTEILNLRTPGPLGGTLGALATGHPLCRFVPLSGCIGWL
jgi:hypothetical protein